MNYARLSILGIMAVAGCASTHVNLYTLSPSPSGATPIRRYALEVRLPPAHVPAQVNRREIMVRQSGDRLALLENEQWASSLGDEISSAALLEFSAQFAKSDPSSRQRVTALALSIDVHQFEAVMGRNAIVSATWNAEIRQGSDIIKLSCPFSVSLPIAAGVSAVVVGYQQAIAELGDAMALGVVTSVSQHHGICPSGG